MLIGSNFSVDDLKLYVIMVHRSTLHRPESRKMKVEGWCSCIDVKYRFETHSYSRWDFQWKSYLMEIYDVAGPKGQLV